MRSFKTGIVRYPLEGVGACIFQIIRVFLLVVNCRNIGSNAVKFFTNCGKPTPDAMGWRIAAVIKQVAL